MRPYAVAQGAVDGRLVCQVRRVGLGGTARSPDARRERIGVGRGPRNDKDPGALGGELRGGRGGDAGRARDEADPAGEAMRHRATAATIRGRGAELA